MENLDQIAKRLNNLSFNGARKEIYRLDSDADLKYWRNAIGDEYHSLFVLPNAGLSITLVEEQDQRPLNQDDDNSADPKNRRRLKVRYSYADARVEPLMHRVANSTGVA